MTFNCQTHLSRSNGRGSAPDWFSSRYDKPVPENVLMLACACRTPGQRSEGPFHSLLGSYFCLEFFQKLPRIPPADLLPTLGRRIYDRLQARAKNEFMKRCNTRPGSNLRNTCFCHDLVFKLIHNAVVFYS